MPDGGVPLGEYADAIRQVKLEIGLKVVVHTGLVSESVAEKLAYAHVDAALMDVVGSNETIHRICRSKADVEDYERSLAFLSKAGIPLVPHILVGLHHGHLKGEFNAVEMISKYNPNAVVIIALTPARGTAMESVDPPAPEDIVRVLLTARTKLPRTPIALGCVRPRGRHRGLTDILAVRSGVNAIAFPSRQAVEEAKSLGLGTSFSPLCCCQVHQDITPVEA